MAQDIFDKEYAFKVFHLVSGSWPRDITIEDLYQSFKARLVEELQVSVTTTPPDNQRFISGTLEEKGE